MKRVGHKGADLIAPGNTLESFDAAIAAGVDMIEFDVLPVDHEDRANSPLVLAHDYGHDLANAPSLAAGLDHLAALPVELDVDLKLAGYEDRVIAALAERDLLDRTLVTSMETDALDRVRAIHPGQRVGWSIPKVRRDYTAHPLFKLPAAGMLALGRAIAPGRVAAGVRKNGYDAVMAFDALVTPRLVRATRDAGAELYAWTVDDADRIAQLEAMGVTGVITNDPRLFQRITHVPAL